MKIHHGNSFHKGLLQAFRDLTKQGLFISFSFFVVSQRSWSEQDSAFSVQLAFRSIFEEGFRRPLDVAY